MLHCHLSLVCWKGRYITMTMKHSFAVRAATHYHTQAWQTLINGKECFILLITWSLFLFPFRSRKCNACYRVLMDIRTVIDKKTSLSGKVGDTFRQLQILLGSLDWSILIHYVILVSPISLRIPQTGLKLIQLFSCLTQLSMKFQLLMKTQMQKNHNFSFHALKLSDVVLILLINAKMPTINCWHFSIYEQDKISCSVDLSLKSW